MPRFLKIALGGSSGSFSASRAQALQGPEGPEKNKQSVKKYIQQLPDGEIHWQQLQAEVYGSGLLQASMFPDVIHFFEYCKQHFMSVCIISHKTIYAKQDKNKINLRTSAIQWLEHNQFFYPHKTNLRKEDVYFANSRDEKISFIKKAQCDTFIDDLPEVLLDSAFPDNVTKIFFNPGNRKMTELESVQDWNELIGIFHGFA